MADPARQEPSGRLWVIINEVRDRLRPVCPDLPEREFETMVERIALTQYKFEGQNPRAPRG
jgi:hypothetical protein